MIVKVLRFEKQSSKPLFHNVSSAARLARYPDHVLSSANTVASLPPNASRCILTNPSVETSSIMQRAYPNPTNFSMDMPTESNSPWETKRTRDEQQKSVDT